MREKYHFIGIGGIGMSALATILLQKGIRVSGSDMASSAITEDLQKKGAEIFIGHSEQNVQEPSAIVLSTDIKDANPEVQFAQTKGVPFLHRSELMHRLMRGYSPLLVTGTHGKTTTSSLLAHLLIDAGLDPSYAVGGLISNLHSNGGYGRGNYFVAEADESDGTFLNYTPFGAIVTNIGNDHLDYWKTLDAMTAGYKQFIDAIKSPEHFLWCGDDAILRSLKPKGFSYGFGKKNDLFIQNFLQTGWKNVFDISFEGTNYSEIEIPLIGGHNVLNAAAVFGLGLRAQIPEDKIREAFANFKGISRRVEFKGEQKGIAVFDDYGHHPTEIFATLRAVKHAIGHSRLVVAFQPHRYTRTRDCLHEFAGAFEKSDLLVITDIYSAREAPIDGISSQLLLKTIKENASIDAHYVPRHKIAEHLAKILQSGDVLITMGAGDITHVGNDVLELLSK